MATMSCVDELPEILRAELQKEHDRGTEKHVAPEMSGVNTIPAERPLWQLLGMFIGPFFFRWSWLFGWWRFGLLNYEKEKESRRGRLDCFWNFLSQNLKKKCKKFGKIYGSTFPGSLKFN